MFEWKAEYSVGIGSIDGQHQKLFTLTRELHQAMNAGQGRAAVARILDRLVQYTVVHFALEERLMEECGYPGLEEHRIEHESLTKKVLAFQADYEAGRGPMSVQLLLLLRGWLEHHIQEEDQAYAPYLKAAATL
jgi:hemerythrin